MALQYVAGESVTPQGAAFSLSPMQSGMLFQALLDSDADLRVGYDVEQMHVVVEEAIEKAPFAEAWTTIARRHQALTASFRWEGVEQPVQRFHPDVVVPVEAEDWSSLSDEERANRRAKFLESDRRRGFDLRRPPLMRVTLFRCGPARTEVVWTFHHILIDGRSFPPILEEVFAAWSFIREGRPIDLPPPPRPYGDYITWLRERDAGPSLAFFKAMLAGKATPTPLPCAEPANRPLSGPFGEVCHHVDRTVVDAARELARRTKTTMGTVVQAAWAAVLARTTGDTDVVFGSTRACRRSALKGTDADAMIGLFINTVPVRVSMDDARTVADILAQLRQDSVAMREHEHTPLVDIQGQSALPRGTSLFETILMFENRETNEVLRGRDARWNSRVCTLHERPSPPLTLTVFDGATSFEIRMLYDGRRYREATVARLARYLEAALHSLAEHERDAASAIDVLPADERKRILFDWNDTPRPFPEDITIQQPFEARAKTQPDAIAVEMDGVTATYAELDARANRLAHALRARGAKPGVFVGVCLDRGPELVTALLAVAKSGAAYVPLDPAYPTDRIAFMLDDAKAVVVVTEKRHRELFTAPVLIINGDDAAAVAAMPSEAPERLGKPTDVCYAIFTSGSTGKPKGVVLTHDAVVNTFDWVTRNFEIGPKDRLLWVTSPCFDLSVYDTFGALGAGATVVVASEARLKEPRALAAAIVEQKITVWDSAPAALQLVTSFFPETTKTAPLRLVMLSGDWIPIGLPGIMRAAFPNVRLMSLGGATEAAIWSNWFPIGELDPRWTSVPYGRPIQNSRYHVLDAAMRPVPIGVPGDLYIGGRCLAQGYLNRPELTAERFVKDPFSNDPGQRLYKTGDLARYFDDGNLEFLGRADFQVKIRGFRVELGEVEAALIAIPAVSEAVCTADVDATGQKALVGYVTLNAGATADDRELKATLAKKLPSFMVPSQIMILERMPVSPNGKLDRKALPSLSARPKDAEYVAPRSERERAFAKIWETVLRKEKVGVTDNFFELGGDSMLAVMLVATMQRELKVEVPLSRVLQRPTIEGLVGSLEAEGARTASHLITLETDGSGPHLVLISGIGGYGFMYRPLASDLKGTQPIHVLNAVGLEDDGIGPHHSIEEIAETYEPQVLAACPDGEIVLGGYSFGVLVAFELAHRLVKRGRKVPLIISFDGFAPGFPKKPAWVRAHLDMVLKGDGGARADYVKGRLRNVKVRLYSLFGRGHEVFDAPDEAHPEQQARLREVGAGLWRARNAYRPRHPMLDCDLLLIKTTNPRDWPRDSFKDSLYGWPNFVSGRVDTAMVEGEHLRMFHSREAQRAMAEIIQGTMRRLGGG